MILPNNWINGCRRLTVSIRQTKVLGEWNSSSNLSTRARAPVMKFVLMCEHHINISCVILASVLNDFV